MSWPRLSDTLTGPKHPTRCQSCGGHALELVDGQQRFAVLERWQECDEQDQPERIVVVLCHQCAAQLVEAHPRLYRALQKHEPYPGCMEICIDCVHREGVRCAQAKCNGGPGVYLKAPRPTQAMVCYGRGRGGLTRFYAGPATACSARQTIADWRALNTPDPGENAATSRLAGDALGSCCICQGAHNVYTIVTLSTKAPIPGRGWGCVQCELAPDGATAVVCDQCAAEHGDQVPERLRFVCCGYPALDGRVAITTLTGTHAHDRTKHPEVH